MQEKAAQLVYNYCAKQYVFEDFMEEWNHLKSFILGRPLVYEILGGWEIVN